MPSKILIIGTGAFGSALANILLFNKHQVDVYGVDQNQINDYNQQISFFKKPFCNKFHSVSNDLPTLLKNNPDFILCAVPSFALLSTIDNIVKIYNKPIIFINTAKGKIDFSKHQKIKIVNMFGPSFAKEVFDFELTSFTLASKDLDDCKKVEKIFQCPYMRFCLTTDVNSTLIYPYLKNVGAVAMGLVYGMTKSINTRAYYFTTLLQEITKIIKANGGKEESLLAYGAIGDIYLTCLHNDSRNFQLGYAIAEQGLKKALADNTVTVEGYTALKNCYSDLKKNKCEFLLKVYDIVYNNKNINILLK